jgi:glycerol-3-phosphate dehydrogenase (NAD(P)+)
MPAPTVAVVGAGAWGTTLAKVIASGEPVTLLCRSPEVADEIARTRRNQRRLPDIDLP